MKSKTVNEKFKSIVNAVLFLYKNHNKTELFQLDMSERKKFLEEMSIVAETAMAKDLFGGILWIKCIVMAIAHLMQG